MGCWGLPAARTSAAMALHTSRVTSNRCWLATTGRMRAAQARCRAVPLRLSTSSSTESKDISPNVSPDIKPAMVTRPAEMQMYARNRSSESHS